MSTYKADALVIRSREYKEADRLITLYSREHGKISALARGVRKGTSKQRGGVQLYTYADFVLYKGRSLDTIQQAASREVFLYLWDDYDRATVAGCMAALLDAATPDGETDEKVFLLSLKAFFMLEILEPWLALAAYGLRLMAHLGYLSEDADLEDPAFSGFKSPSLNEGTKSIIRQLFRMNWEHLERLRLSTMQRREIFRVLRVFCESKVERKLHAWRSFEEECLE